jgi:hypothetical protein
MIVVNFDNQVRPIELRALADMVQYHSITMIDPYDEHLRYISGADHIYTKSKSIAEVASVLDVIRLDVIQWIKKADENTELIPEDKFKLNCNWLQDWQRSKRGHISPAYGFADRQPVIEAMKNIGLITGNSGDILTLKKVTAKAANIKAQLRAKP